MSDFKAVEQRMPEPFPEIRIDVRPVSVFGKPGVIGHSVGIMDTHTGHGTRSSMDYAEAKAKAVLKAIRAYRRKNATHLSAEPEPCDHGSYYLGDDGHRYCIRCPHVTHEPGGSE